MMKIYISASLKRSEDQQKQLGIPSGQQLTPAGCCKCPYLLKHFPLQFTMSPLPPVTAFSSILNTSDYLCLTNFTPTFDLCVCAQSCPTLCDSMDCNLPGFSAHRVFQAKILEWVAISYSRTFDLLDPSRHLNLQTLMEK